MTKKNRERLVKSFAILAIIGMVLGSLLSSILFLI